MSEMNPLSSWIVAACVTLGISLPAAAADSKAYAGSECVTWSGSSPRIVLSDLQNAGSDTLYVDCPGIQNIQKAGMTVQGTTSGALMYLDTNPNEDLSCVLAAVYPMFGQPSIQYYFSANATSSGSSPNYRIMNFSSVTRTNYSWYYVGCSIPPVYNGSRSSIATYEIIE